MKNKNKAATAATAVVLSAALLMTGTFAWNDFSQKKLNELAGVLNYDVALVEDFEETSDWSFANPDVNKDVSAANKGDNAAYVRVNLREYLQVRPFTYTNDSYVKDAEGNPVRFAVDKNGEYIESTAADPTTDPNACKVDFGGDIGVKYFIVAQGADQAIAQKPDNTNLNGQIGKFMIDPLLPDGGKVYDDDKVEHYGAAKKADTADDEMTYAIHKFTDTPDPWQTKVEEYVSWKMGPDVKTMAEYKVLPADDKKDAKFWIVDADGWCYWSHPLAKDEQTTLLLDAATLKKAPKGDLYYAIHSTMQAVDKENLGWWATDATDDAKNDFFPDINDGETVKPKILATGVSLDQTTLQLNDAEPVKLTATVEPAEAEQDVKWTSSNTSVATVDKDGNVTATGQGTATITAATKDGTNMKEECTVDVPTWVSVTGVNLPSTLSLKGLETKTLTADVTPNDAINKKVTWQSSDTSIATVNENGEVTGVAIGKATITATTVEGGFTSSCNVSVAESPATGVLGEFIVYVSPGGPSYSLTHTLLPATTTDTQITYSSADESIAKVDADSGLVTATGSPGQTTNLIITTESKTLSQTIPITIVDKTIAMGINPVTQKPLHWIVVKEENGKALLLSADMIKKSMTYFDTDGVPAPWADSNVCHYLNGEFLTTCFTAEEQARIQETEVITNISKTAVHDMSKIFIMGYYSTDNYPQADFSAYIKATYEYWTRSQSPQYNICFINQNGSGGSVSAMAKKQLRPLMWVTLP